jgi:hypothetical protein
MKKFAISPLFVALLGSAAAAQGSITINAHPAVEQLVQRHIAYNVQHPNIEGYRIRIYRDNSSNARQRSQDVSDTFADMFTDIPVYRSYDNPYFKVSVGDFRTKDDALRLYVRIKRMHPNAYIVQEEINLPQL